MKDAQRKTKFNAVGMEYLKPRLLNPLISCTGYVFSDPLHANCENTIKICIPENRGPCVYGCGYIKNFKFWEGPGNPPSDPAEIYRTSHVESTVIEDLLNWCEVLGNKYYKQLKSIKLFGSYAKGTAREDSDIDILIELSNDCNFKDIHKKISFDRDLSKLPFEPDAWFLRPDGLVTKYKQRSFCKPLEFHSGFRNSRLIRNTTQSQEEACCKHIWTDLYENIQTARVLYEKKSA